jgi:hypothetical protein
MKIATIAALAIALTACSGTEEKVVYLPATEAPDTTVKKVTPTTEPTSSLDDSDYLTDEDMFLLGIEIVSTLPSWADEQTLLDTGYATCASFDAGMSLDEVAIISVTQAGGDDRLLDLFAAITASAVYNLCPEHSWMFE